MKLSAVLLIAISASSIAAVELDERKIPGFVITKKIGMEYHYRSGNDEFNSTKEMYDKCVEIRKHDEITNGINLRTNLMFDESDLIQILKQLENAGGYWYITKFEVNGKFLDVGQAVGKAHNDATKKPKP